MHGFERKICEHFWRQFPHISPQENAIVPFAKPYLMLTPYRDPGFASVK